MKRTFQDDSKNPKFAISKLFLEEKKSKIWLHVLFGLILIYTLRNRSFVALTVKILRLPGGTLARAVGLSLYGTFSYKFFYILSEESNAVENNVGKGGLLVNRIFFSTAFLQILASLPQVSHSLTHSLPQTFFSFTQPLQTYPLHSLRDIPSHGLQIS